MFRVAGCTSREEKVIYLTTCGNLTGGEESYIPHNVWQSRGECEKSINMALAQGVSVDKTALSVARSL